MFRSRHSDACYDRDNHENEETGNEKKRNESDSGRCDGLHAAGKLQRTGLRGDGKQCGQHRQLREDHDDRRRDFQLDGHLRVTGEEADRRGGAGAGCQRQLLRPRRYGLPRAGSAADADRFGLSGHRDGRGGRQRDGDGAHGVREQQGLSRAGHRFDFAVGRGGLSGGRNISLVYRRGGRRGESER